MPWGWECRQKLIKQNPAKPTERKGPITGEFQFPGPNKYEQPEICGGKGFSKIKRAPAYTFGHRTKLVSMKPLLSMRAPQLDVSGTKARGGRYKIPGIVVGSKVKGVQPFNVPGPASYKSSDRVVFKQPPMYGLGCAARPRYVPWDQWTPPPNMYWPPLPGKNPPKYSLGIKPVKVSRGVQPGPGQHNPNFGYVQKSKPAFSFGAPFRPIKPPVAPPPNAYCEKKFMVKMPNALVPSFGIKHSPFLGKRDEYLKPPDLKPMISGN